MGAVIRTKNKKTPRAVRRKRAADQDPDENFSEKASPPGAMKKVIKNTREEYVEPIAEPEDSEPEAEADPPPRDLLWEFLEQLDEQHALTLRIDRLPQHHLTGLWAKGQPAEYCAEVPVGKETLVTGAYLDMIRGEWGPGAYRLTLRGYRGQQIRRWLERIAPRLDGQTVAGPGNTRITIHGAGGKDGQAAPAPDALAPFKQFAETAKQFKTIAESLSVLSPGAPANGSAVAAPEVVKNPTFEEQLLTAALEAAIKKGDESGVDRLVDKVLGRKGGGDWGEVVVEKIIDAVGPRLPDVISAVASLFTGRPAPPVAPAPVAELQRPRAPRQVREVPAADGPHGFYADPENPEICRRCGLRQIHLIHSGLPPVAPGEEPEEYIDADPEESDPPEFGMVDDFIDGLLALLIGAHLHQRIDEGALQRAVDDVRSFADSNVIFRPFVNALINGEASTVVGMALARRPDLAEQMGESEVVRLAVAKLQERLRERGR